MSSKSSEAVLVEVEETYGRGSRLRTSSDLDAQEARLSEIEFREWQKRGRPLGSFEGWREDRYRSSLQNVLGA